jgi:hypothetical protein
MKRINVVGIGIAGLSATIAGAALGQMGSTAPTNRQKTEAVVDVSGNLRVPADYSTTYQSLGSWAVAADQGEGSKELHVVYASPGTIAAYRRDRRFPDGTVLVKEVFETATGAMTTGTVSRAETLKGWFVMVKDSKDSYPGSKLWGEGWGWSWFDAADPLKTTSSDYKVNCLGCHVPAQASDWVYVDGYPPLRR